MVVGFDQRTLSPSLLLKYFAKRSNREIRNKKILFSTLLLDGHVARYLRSYKQSFVLDMIDHTQYRNQSFTYLLLLLPLHLQHLLVFIPLLLLLGHRLTGALIQTLSRLVHHTTLDLHPRLVLLRTALLSVENVLKLLLRRCTTASLLHLLRMLPKNGNISTKKTLYLFRYQVLYNTYCER